MKKGSRPNRESNIKINYSAMPIHCPKCGMKHDVVEFEPGQPVTDALHRARRDGVNGPAELLEHDSLLGLRAREILVNGFGVGFD